MSPIESVRDLQKIAYGFMGSKALFAALDLELFGLLADGPKTSEELAAKTGAPPNLLGTLLTACVSIGLIEKQNGAYSNSPAAQRYLTPSSPAFFGDYYRFQIDRQVYPALDALHEAVVGKTTRGLYSDAFEDSQRAEDFFRGQHSGSLGPAYMLAKQADLTGRQTLLDVGGGSGAFSIVLCKRNPGLTATILDFQPVVDIARRYVTAAGLADRISFTPGDASAMQWPREQDAALMSYLLSAVPEGQRKSLFRKAWDCLKPGGLVLVHDFVVNDEGTGPAESALWGLAMALGNPGATNLSRGELLESARHAGFVKADVQPLIEGVTSLLMCEKPSS